MQFERRTEASARARLLRPGDTKRAESIRKLVKKLGLAKQLRVYYEADPTGYVSYWQLATLDRYLRRHPFLSGRKKTETNNIA